MIWHLNSVHALVMDNHGRHTSCHHHNHHNHRRGNTRCARRMCARAWVRVRARSCARSCARWCPLARRRPRPIIFRAFRDCGLLHFVKQPKGNVRRCLAVLDFAPHCDACDVHGRSVAMLGHHPGSVIGSGVCRGRKAAQPGSDMGPADTQALKSAALKRLERHISMANRPKRQLLTFLSLSCCCGTWRR